MNRIRYALYWLRCTLTGSEPQGFKVWKLVGYMERIDQAAERFNQKQREAVLTYMGQEITPHSTGPGMSAKEWQDQMIDQQLAEMTKQAKGSNARPTKS